MIASGNPSLIMGCLRPQKLENHTSTVVPRTLDKSKPGDEVSRCPPDTKSGGAVLESEDMGGGVRGFPDGTSGPVFCHGGSMGPVTARA